MKIPYFTLVAVIFISSIVQSHAQIILGSYYDSYAGLNNPSDPSMGFHTPAPINTVADFTAAGVTGPGGAPLDSSDTVTGFDFNPAVDHSGLTSYTSNGLTLNIASGAQYFQRGSGVFQSSVFNVPQQTLTGLSSILNPNSTYTLYVFSHPIFNDGTEGNFFQYGSQSGTVEGTSPADSLATFTFTTGATVTDSLYFSGFAGSNGTPATFPSVTGFAIVAQSVPEPSTYALFGLGLVLLLSAYRNRRLSSVRVLA